MRPLTEKKFQHNRDEFIYCKIAGFHKLEMMIDSGSPVNIIDEANNWPEIQLQVQSGMMKIYDVNNSSREKLYAYGGSPLQVLAAFSAWIHVIGHENSRVFAKFLVTKGKQPLLSKSTSQALGVLKVGQQCYEKMVYRIEKRDEFPAIPGPPVGFEVDETKEPTQHAYYSVPLAYEDIAQAKLDDMERKGIIARVDFAPTWISGMSGLPKGEDDCRLVVNMKGPNLAIKRTPHPFFLAVLI